MIYNKEIEWNDKKAAAFLSEPRVKKMIEECPSQCGIVADLGCYTGDISQKLAAKDNQVLGLDCSQVFVDMTARKGFVTKLADFERHIPVLDSTVDAVVAGELIEHIYHTETFVKECHRILKPGGKIVITTPNLAYIGHRIKGVFGIPPSILGYEAGEDSEANPGHVRYFTVKTLSNMLQKYGFKVEKVRGSDIMGNEALGDIFPTFAYHIVMTATKQ